MPVGNFEPILNAGVPLFWNYPELEQGVIVLVVDGNNYRGEFFTCIATHNQGVVNRMWKVDDSNLTDLAFRILGVLISIGFHGVSNFSAMKSLEGTWKIIEINPRFTGGTAGRLILGFDEVGKVLLNLLRLELQSFSTFNLETSFVVNRKARDLINWYNNS